MPTRSVTFDNNTLQEIADRYRAMAPEMVGPVPYVIEMFIAQYGSITRTAKHPMVRIASHRSLSS